jgi:hypothetical protein
MLEITKMFSVKITSMKKIFGKNLFVNGRSFPISYDSEDRRDRDRMMVGFTSTCAINAYHH